jgi:hypothetical protein
LIREMDQQIRLSSFGIGSHDLKIIKDNIILDGLLIDLNDVGEIKFAVTGIQFDMFTVGRNFHIELKADEKKIRLDLKCFFGIREKYFAGLYQSILNEIWELTVVRLFHQYVENILDGSNYRIGNCVLLREGISLKNEFIGWRDMAYEVKYDRITLNHKSNPKLWSNIYFFETYNSQVLRFVLDWVFLEKGLEELERKT